MRMREQRSEGVIGNITGIICTIVSVVVMIYICRFACGDDIWYDEVFSLGFIRGNIRELISLTAVDVHPPLYYIYLKAVCGIATGLWGEEILIPAAKAASIIPWCGVLALALTVIRKRYGMTVAGFFMLLVTVMPQLGTYYLEIRMYSFALLLITAAILTGIGIVCDDKKPGIVHFVMLVMLGIMTAYTQYYACIAIIGLYIAMFVLILTGKDEEKRYKLKGITVCAVASSVLYLPWIPTLLKQMGNISGNYWIQPLTLRSIPGCIKFIVLPVSGAGVLGYVAAALVLITMGIVTILFLRKKDKCGKIMVMLSIASLLFTVVSGFVLSLAGTPIFVYRYMIPALGGLYLAFAVMADRVAEGKWIPVILCPFLITGFLSIMGLRDEEGKKIVQMQHAEEVLRSIPEGSDIITNFDHVTAVMGYYRPDLNIHLYDAETDRLIRQMFVNVDDELGDDQVAELVRNESPVFFMGSFNSRDDIVADWEKIGIGSELKDSMLIERYWINLYELRPVVY